MKKLICIIFAVLMLASCARTPKEILAPKMKIDNSGASAKVIIEFSVFNDNHSTVFVNYSGKMILKTVEGKVIAEKDFKIDRIMPYTSSTAVVEAEVTAENLAILAEASQIDATELAKKSVIEDVFVVEEMIELKKVSTKKSDIIDILKGK